MTLRVGDGPVRDVDRGLRHDAADVAEDETQQVDAVRGEVAQHAVAAAVHGVPPGQGAARMGGVVGEQLHPGVRRDSDPTGLDDAPGPGDGGDVAVVEADAAHHTGSAHGRPDRRRVTGGEAHGLLDPQVLARLGDRHTDLPVQEVGGRDAHRLEVGVSEQLAPVGVRRQVAVRAAEPLHGRPGRVGDGHELRAHREVRPVLGEALVGPRVDVAHPARPDDADLEGLHGGVSGSWWVRGGRSVRTRVQSRADRTRTSGRWRTRARGRAPRARHHRPWP